MSTKLTAADRGLMVPTVHMNGTSKRALVDGFAESASAVRQALGEVAQHGPNARDYYVQGARAFGAAMDQHVARMARLSALAEEYDALCEAVAK